MSFAVLYGVIRCDEKSDEKIHFSLGENLELVLTMKAGMYKFPRYERSFLVVYELLLAFWPCSLGLEFAFHLIFVVVLAEFGSALPVVLFQ